MLTVILKCVSFPSLCSVIDEKIVASNVQPVKCKLRTNSVFLRSKPITSHYFDFLASFGVFFVFFLAVVISLSMVFGARLKSFLRF